MTEETAIQEKNKSLRQTMVVILFFILFLAVLQVSISRVVDKRVIYNERMDYDMIKNRPSNISVVLETISETIKEEKLKDYVVLLGDSVAYSGSCPADQSLGVYIEKTINQSNKNVKVFNLSLPSNQIGDVYTLLMEMDKYGISRDHVVINLIYSGFLPRNPDPPAAFWFGNQLKHLDPESYQRIENSLEINMKTEQNILLSKIEDIREPLYDLFAVTRYKDYIRAEVLIKTGKYQPTFSDKASKPWYKKPKLVEMLQKPEYHKYFSDTPFVMDSTNDQIYFLEKIIKLQENKKNLFFLTGVNEGLLKEEVNKPGYIENIQKIDSYFASKKVQYINVTGQINNRLYSDHIHFIAEGYDQLSQLLVPEINKWFK